MPNIEKIYTMPKKNGGGGSARHAGVNPYFAGILGEIKTLTQWFGGTLVYISNKDIDLLCKFSFYAQCIEHSLSRINASLIFNDNP